MFILNIILRKLKLSTCSMFDSLITSLRWVTLWQDVWQTMNLVLLTFRKKVYCIKYYPYTKISWNGLCLSMWQTKNISGDFLYKRGQTIDWERVYLHIVNVNYYIEHIVFYLLNDFHVHTHTDIFLKFNIDTYI